MSNLPAIQQNFPVSDIRAMAEAVAKSKLFGMKTADEALALMLIAQAEGLHPAIAARDYHVIQGRPTLKADAMMARFQAAGGTVKWDAYTPERVVGVFSHPQGGTVEVEWTLKMAQDAGLTKNPTWKQYPRQMLRARTISEGIRTVFPGVVVGCYSPEEVEDFAPREVEPVPISDAKVQTVEAEVVPPKASVVSEIQAKYRPRIKTALDTLFGDDTAAKKKECEALTEYRAENGSMVAGVADYRKLDGKTLQILAHRLESTVAAAAKNAATQEAA